MSGALSSAKNGERNILFDVAKGIGILFIVMGHAGINYSNILYLFHVPLFFFISGRFFQYDYANSREYVFKKFVRLYLPNFKYGLIFLLCHNVFVSIYILPSTDLYSWKDYMYAFGKIVIFGNELIGGAMWYLRTLFFIYLLMFVLLRLAKKVKNEYQSLLTVIGVLIVTVLFWNLAYIDKLFPLRTVFISGIALPFFCMGYLSKRFNWNWKYKYRLFTFVACLAILVVSSNFIHVNLAYLDLPHFYLFYFVAFIGIFGTLSVSGLFGKSVSQALAYIGRHTIPILALHFLAFKVVTLFYLKIHQNSIADLSSFPVLLNINFMWGYLYSLVGVAFPLLISALCTWGLMILKRFFKFNIL